MLIWFRLTRAQRGYTALIYAAASCQTECLRLLLDAGADKDARDNVRVIGSVVSALGLVCGSGFVGFFMHRLAVLFCKFGCSWQ
jgi:hypothetical protein